MFRKLSIKASLYTPNFVHYWSDFFGVYPLIRKSLTLRIFVIVLVFVTIAVIKTIIHENISPIRHILPILRTYLLLEVFILLFKNTSLSPQRLFLYAVLANFIVVLIGQIDISMYRTVNNFFNGNQRFVALGSTVASIVITERNSGIFSQPSSAGVFCLVTVAVLLNYNFKKLFIFIPLITYVGFLTLSSVFLYGLPLLLIIRLISNCMLNKLTLFFYIIANTIVFNNGNSCYLYAKSKFFYSICAGRRSICI